MPNDEVLKNIEMSREKFNEIWESMSADDFARVHAKFMGALISVEEGFKKRFPTEWKRYEKEFYGDE